MSPRKLVIFTSLPEVGGHSTTTLKLCEILRPLFDEIHVLIKDIPGHGFSPSARDHLEGLGARTLRFSGRGAGEWWKVTKSCRRADVFLAIGMRHLSPVLALLLGARQSVYYHITHELSPDILRQLRLYGCAFSKLVFLSPATARLYSERTGTSASPWAIQPTELALQAGEGTAIPARPPASSAPVRIGFLGRLNQEKGVGLLADFVSASEPHCVLVSAGRGPLETMLRDCQLRQPDRFECCGSFSSGERDGFLARFFSKIDILCVPSLDDREGIPNVIFEALQFGVPVLATRTGGMRSFEMPELGPADPSVVRIVEPADFSAALAAIVSGKPCDAALPGRCRDYFRSRFSDAVLARRWREVLE